MVLIMTPNANPYGFFMKKISSIVFILFINMLAASAPVYAGDEKTAREDSAKVEAADKEKKEGAEDEEPDCD